MIPVQIATVSDLHVVWMFDEEESKDVKIAPREKENILKPKPKVKHDIL